VTGSAGFIGSHLSEALVAKGNDIIGLDRFSDYYPASIKRKNITKLLGNSRFQLIRADLAYDDISRNLDGVEVVFHLAAQAGVRASWGNTFDVYVKDNIIATQRLLEAVKKIHLKKFIYCSTSSVYGDAESFPTSEEALPRPKSPYGATKLAAEGLCNVYRSNFQVPTVILRYFTVYGPRQRPDMAFNRFISSISAGKELTVYGSGNQQRDFTYCADTVAATIMALRAKTGSIYNVGSGRTVPLLEAISLIEELVGRKAKTKFVETQAGDVEKTSAAINKIKNELGYSPKMNLADGLNRQVAWQRPG
jgi:nucleoside-diphosphate-sugar epimerase